MKRMSVNEVKQIIEDDRGRRLAIQELLRYYDNENDIVRKGVVPADKDPLRNADNRIAHNFHELMVDEKAGYMFTYPVIFDTGKKEVNNKITEVLGDEFEDISQGLCIDASNAGKTWLHYWIDKEGKFLYDAVADEQIIPVYKNTLKRVLEKLYRYYQVEEPDETIPGKVRNFVYFEHWEIDGWETFKFEGTLESTGLKYIETEEFLNKLKEIPFIKFANNRKEKSDLLKYKKQIDLYDRVMSGFANDLEDIQQIIYILENYGGQDLNEFLSDLKRYKAIKTDTSEGGTHGGVNTLQIEIPVEARKVILEVLKKQIYESGQALQQDTESYGNASGVALKFFYRKLELKAGMMQTQFKKGFSTFIRAILKYLTCDVNMKIIQTWTRNMISNDKENSEIAQNSNGIISQKTILKNHPWVEDPEEELKQIKSESEQQYSFPKQDDDDEGNDDSKKDDTKKE